MRVWLAVAGLFLAATAVTARAAEQQSLTFQIDAAHDGATTFKGGFTPPLVELWRTDFTGRGDPQRISFPIVVGSTLYVTVYYEGAKGAYLDALDAKTGKILWSDLIKGSSQYASATYDNGQLFVLDVAGQLEAFDAASGTMLWQQQIQGEAPFFPSPPIAQDGLIFFAGYTDSGRIYAFDEANGNLVWWHYVTNGAGRGVPTLVDGTVMMTFPCFYYKFNEADGTLLWEKHLGCEGGGGKTAVYHNGKYFVRDYGGGGDLILQAKNGKKAGTFPLNAYTPPAMWKSPSGQTLGIYTDSNFVYAFDVKTGAVVWTFAEEESMQIAPIVIDGLVVCGSLYGNLYLLDAATGKLKWKHFTGSPISGQDEQNLEPMGGFAAAGGTVYIPENYFLSAYGKAGH
jgi:outer membrane protein assembly factor BamB